MKHNELIEQGMNRHRHNPIAFEGQPLPSMMYPEKNLYGVYDYHFPYTDQSFQPMYINPKQLNWIMKRKARRDVLDSLMVANRRNYLHESRHIHAMKRLRAPSGRFLTKRETEEFIKKNGS
ncbi:subunit B of CCAAT-binding transcription factor [Ordospora colligata]|uniref:Transcriptional activator HAP2 n=1 Tax=Ordospora colligata OC4 TaxID=1354746 RepID=A0A0B2UG19_9MICR|nr:subunit B of CCAAT-binding transcription factor [Ordospora colligata OC4]KHN70036.1 subunit B of CCAAT-binding transcription factor [Ordospora colligata OC4]TBU16418.1 subunit B of CCAAT-binding transcription factor [Ordospora colligata]TBU16603.1 subunit B of CCAAT-binding transcription factor [Ordospora colligata]TBU19176.1 subunit B of CCAAT-binding transcription factor [Ordospora colligata]